MTLAIGIEYRTIDTVSPWNTFDTRRCGEQRCSRVETIPQPEHAQLFIRLNTPDSLPKAPA